MSIDSILSWIIMLVFAAGGLVVLVAIYLAWASTRRRGRRRCGLVVLVAIYLAWASTRRRGRRR